MMNEVEQLDRFTPDGGPADLRGLLRIVWKGRWLIVGFTFTAALIAILIVLMLPDIYRAEAVLAPSDEEGAGGLSALATQYGGLASLAGINLGGGKVDKTALGLQILQSRKFISEFVERHKILVPLMAADGWDSRTNSLSLDSDDYDVAANTWVRDPGPAGNVIPSLQEAYGRFTDILLVEQDPATGFVTIGIEFYSPTIARQWVDWLVDDLNAYVMRRDVAEAEQAINYLHQQIASTSLAELQNVFFRLIEEQTKTMLLAEVSNEYLLRTLDPAIAPEVKSAPHRSLIVILISILGGLTGVLIQLFVRGGDTTLVATDS